MKITIKSLIIGLIFTSSFLSANFSLAATVFFGSTKDKITTGDIFEVDFFINTDGENINALEGNIILPKQVTVKEVRDGGSVISFWMQRPSIQAGKIYFSGIIPGGYASQKGYILTLVLQSVSEGKGLITTQDLKILLNDGRGTLSKVSISDLTLTVLPKLNTSNQTTPIVETNFISASKNDSVLPEMFVPKIISTAGLFDGQYFLVFGTQDKGSGIDYYEVCEAGDKSCLKVDSPYLLKNQKLSSVIIIKAVDKNNNARIVTINNDYLGSWFKYSVLFGILLLILILIIIYKIKRHAKL